MKIDFRILAIPVLLMATNSAFAGRNGAAPECVNANPDNVTDIQNCLARTPGMQIGLQQATVNATVCKLAKDTIAEAQRETRSKEDVRVPTCNTVAKALTELNGVRPLWAECTGYDGSQGALNRCAASYMQGRKQNIAADCFTFRLLIVGAIEGASDNTFNVQKDGPSCEMVSKALASQGIRMTLSECLGYRPNDQRHMEQCIKPTLLSLPSRSAPPSCDDLRRYYRANVASLMTDPAQIQTFAIPTCPMIESAAKSVLAAQGTATTNTAATPAIPAQAPTATPANYTSAQPYANAPVAQPNSRNPVAKPNTANSSYDSYSVETKQQERERRDIERAAKAQGKIDAANQIMGTLGIGGATGSPAAGQSAAPADYGTAPQAVETDAQRKARETQQKINDAADTVNAVKGIFNAFDSTK